jgi:hypothetical protein
MPLPPETPHTPGNQLTPEMLERMRTIGLELDRAGVFWQGATAVTHARLRQALLRWLDVRADGRDIIKLDDERYAYVTIADAHLRSRSARWQADRCIILWDDDQEAELEYASLRQTPDHALYATVRRLRGRIGSPAYQAIAEHIVEVPGGYALEAAGERWPIAGAA